MFSEDFYGVYLVAEVVLVVAVLAVALHFSQDT
ncbi:hypothetical protein SAMN02745903_00111 [Pseudomonas sp. URMO17WK12:I5]|jgi:hypothetical protein|nr:hypothetical protein H040_00111 [Pseudomonas sp. URMO17WK12:I7]SME90072.1 hypothetical protein SAMN02745903_00111 [Pseudomonas sp. URMO17WK12:I5]